MLNASNFFLYKSNTGINLLIQPINLIDIIDVSVIVKSGSLNDNECCYGLAHLLEHMIFKGSKNYPNNIISTLDTLGAYFNAYTSFESTGYKINGLTMYFEQFLSILVDMFYNALLDSNHIENEKNIVIEELNNDSTRVLRILEYKLNSMLSINTKKHYNIPIIGFEKNIREITPSILKEYKNKYYCNENSLFIIKGDITIKLLNIIEKVFSTILQTSVVFNKYEYNASVLDNSIYYVSITNSIKLKDRYFFLIDKGDNYYVSICFPSYKKFSSNIDIIHILSIILAGNLTSYIPKILREKYGISYSQGYKHINYDVYGAFILYAYTSKPYNAILLILSILKELLIIGINESDLINARNTYLTQQILTYQNINSDIMAEEILYKTKINKIDDIKNTCNKITVDDINNILLNIVNKKYLYILASGPTKLKLKFIKKILNKFAKE